MIQAAAGAWNPRREVGLEDGFGVHFIASVAASRSITAWKRRKPRKRSLNGLFGPKIVLCEHGL
jgi:hypothetical protein